jgi:hypothetical protein
MMNRWFWSTLLMLTITAALQGQSRESVLKAVQQTSKWLPADKPVQYDSKNIEDLDGKRAAAINRYGLTGVTIQNWTGAGGSAHLTLYEMFDPSAAYGLFTLDRNIDQPNFAEIPLGTEGFRLGNRTEFWQSSYVVKLEGNMAAANALGRSVSESIFGQSRKPPVSMHLPPTNLIQGSDKYIVDPSGVARELDIDPQALGFDDSVEMATANYRIGGKTAHLVLLMYPTQQLAKKYEEQWMATSPGDSAFRKRVSALLALVRGSHDESLAKSILDGVNYETQVISAQPRMDISLRTVILTIFSFIGIAFVFTAVVGLSYGGVRVFVKRLYPNRVFDRPQDMEIIQLKLGQGVTPRQLNE